jgi:ectoine hydroxylase-related dioxygenase (phytanoyl-CoA dioxygenase family)
VWTEIFVVELAKRIDTTELRTKGVQVIRKFFSEAVVQDMHQRAREIVALRDAGKLTTYDQDSKGLPNEWFRPLMCNESVLGAVTSAIGPNVCTVGQRVLAKDKHFKFSVHVHQDWPYGSGDTRKVSVFIPLTPMNAANGGLTFIEESHQYGPVSRGAIDLSLLPPMNELCPDVEVGDIILCDFLTWHYSNNSSNGEERILLQFNYQPADDASSNDVVAGVRSHDKLLLSRYDAVEFPQSEINGQAARRLLEGGQADRAFRYARGLLADDDQHAGAALMLAEVLSARGDPSALKYLETARAALRRQLEQLTALDKQYGIQTDVGAAPPPEADASPWKPLGITWKSAIEGQPDPQDVACTVVTSPHAWGYGLVSTPFQITETATIRVKARAHRGKVGFCLIGAGNGPLLSDQHHITPELGEAAVMILATPDYGQVHLVVRNFDDAGVSGEVTLESAEILSHA